MSEQELLRDLYRRAIRLSDPQTPAFSRLHVFCSLIPQAAAYATAARMSPIQRGQFFHTLFSACYALAVVKDNPFIPNLVENWVEEKLREVVSTMATLTAECVRQRQLVSN